MKAIILSIIAAILIIAGSLYLLSKDGKTRGSEGDAGNVSIVDGRQIIEIGAKGGYSPMKSVASAGIPTVIRFNTKGTIDCSSYVRIPSLNLTKALPRTGQTDIDLGVQEAGIFRGSCGMGMYPFEIEFRDGTAS